MNKKFNVSLQDKEGEELSYPGYERQQSVFRVDDSGNISNPESIVFPECDVNNIVVERVSILDDKGSIVFDGPLDPFTIKTFISPVFCPGALKINLK